MKHCGTPEKRKTNCTIKLGGPKQKSFKTAKNQIVQKIGGAEAERFRDNQNKPNKEQFKEIFKGQISLKQERATNGTKTEAHVLPNHTDQSL